MVRPVLLFFFLLLFAGCDPLYHLNYSVKNQTGKTLYINRKNNSYYRPSPVIIIPPDSTVLVHQSTGVGFAKEKFKKESASVAAGLICFSDSVFSDSTQIMLQPGWKYHRSGFGLGNPVLVIDKKDLK